MYIMQQARLLSTNRNYLVEVEQGLNFIGYQSLSIPMRRKTISHVGLAFVIAPNRSEGEAY